MPVPFKSDPPSLRQHQLFPSNIFDLLPEDHDYFLASLEKYMGSFRYG